MWTNNFTNHWMVELETIDHSIGYNDLYYRNKFV